MLDKKARQALLEATRVSVRKEMAKPRMTRSARIAEQNLDDERIVEQPSTTVGGTVDKIIATHNPNKTDKAQIAVDGPERRHGELRIENSLTDENGDDVKLKKGARVAVTVTSKPKK
jgi:hypothetical protein